MGINLQIITNFMTNLKKNGKLFIIEEGITNYLLNTSVSSINIEVVNRVKITDVRIRKINVDGKMKAIVSVTFDNAFVVHDIKVVEGQNGLFVAMPSKKTPDGEFRDVAHPISSEAREIIQKAVLNAFEEAQVS